MIRIGLGGVRNEESLAATDFDFERRMPIEQCGTIPRSWQIVENF